MSATESSPSAGVTTAGSSSASPDPAPDNNPNDVSLAIYDYPAVAALARALKRGSFIPDSAPPAATLGVYISSSSALSSLPAASERLVHMARKRYGLAFAAKRVRFELLDDSDLVDSPYVNLALDAYITESTPAAKLHEFIILKRRAIEQRKKQL
jgi:hypothetical protein